MTVNANPTQEEKKGIMISPSTIMWALSSLASTLLLIYNSKMSDATESNGLKTDIAVLQTEVNNLKTQHNELKAYVYKTN